VAAPVRPDVEVRVLGPVEVAGISKIERSKSIELIVFLAMHPQGVDADRLWEALWPGRPLREGTLYTTASVARSSLGRAPDGSYHLPNAHDGVYRLNPSVRLDWASFRALVARADQPGGGPGDFRRALEQVRGRPFESVPSKSYAWAMAGTAATMEAEIVDAADRLAQLALDGRPADPGLATWAARRGLLASPYDERLYRDLMRAAHAQGNPAGVEAAMEELLRVLEAEDLEPYDALHEETSALYERLRRPRRRVP
jgi:DNA-binding SARP family transcriptional activator